LAATAQIHAALLPGLVAAETGINCSGAVKAFIGGGSGLYIPAQQGVIVSADAAHVGLRFLAAIGGGHFFSAGATRQYPDAPLRPAERINTRIFPQPLTSEKFYLL
jgi:hypothetical protein